MSNESSTESLNPFLPLVLIGASLLMIFIWQVSNTSQQRTVLQNAITQQQQPVQQSLGAQQGLEKIASGLLELAKSNDQAKAIALKFGISRSGVPAAPEAAPSPAK